MGRLLSLIAVALSAAQVFAAGADIRIPLAKLVKGGEPPVDSVARVLETLQDLRAKNPEARLVLTPSASPVVDLEASYFADGTNVVWDGVLPERKPRKSDVPSTAIGYFVGRQKDGNTLANNEWLAHIVRNRRQIAASGGEIDLVFCGDSITHCWESRCPKILKEIRAKHSLLLAGFSGDRTEHLLWRLRYGELDGYRAKCVMMLIGTNNSDDTPEQIAAGVKACLDTIREKQPQAKVLLLPIFPRRDGPQGINGPMMTRPKNVAANGIIRTFADGKDVILVDFGKRFLDKDDDTKWIMPDRLHPQTKGFEIWYEEVKPCFERFCGGSSVGTKWAGWTKGHFQLHAIYTGVAESMFLIYPDGTTMLLDCGDHPAINRGKLAVPVMPDGRRHAGEWIARYVTRVNPAGTKVDYMVTSHFHSDHTGCMIWSAGLSQYNLPLSGFAQAAETLTFGKAVDRGWPNYDDPLPFDDYEKYGSRELMVKLYRILEYLDKDFRVEKFRIGATDQLGPRKDPAACPGFEVKNLCANGKVLMKDGTVKDLYADHIRRDNLRILNENGMSLGMVITYGKFRLYTAGDFEDYWQLPDGSTYYTENDLADAVPRVDVAKVNHHGHRSMREKLVKALSPRIWLSCVWDQLHDTPDTMERLDRAYAGERTYCPCIFPAERRWQDKDAAWAKDVAPESFGGAHVVLDVPPGGETYTITHLDASDEEMRVIGVRRLQSLGK